MLTRNDGLEYGKTKNNLGEIVIKKWCVALAALLVLCFGSFKTYAKDMGESVEKEQYIRSALSIYIGSAVRKGDIISISGEYEINGHPDSNARLILVKKNNTCIGELLVSVTPQGTLFSSFYGVDNFLLDEWVSESKPIGFLLINDILAVQSEKEYLFLGKGDNKLYPVQKNQMIQQHSCRWTVCPMQAHSSTKSGNSCYLPLGIVGSGSAGACWAACCAMVSNYRIHTSYSADEVYFLLLSFNEGAPAGTTYWYNRFFDFLGMTRANSTRLSYAYLLSSLQTGRPVIFRIYPNTNSSIGHAIVLRAMEPGDENPTYSFADPNYLTNYLTVVVSDSTGNSFPIITNSGTYYDWRCYVR